jgi:hypothetical protein
VVFAQDLIALCPHTKSFMPSDLQNNELLIDDSHNLLRSKEDTNQNSQDPSSNKLQQPPEPATPAFPRLSQYCPRPFMATFDDSFDSFSRAEDMDNISKATLEDSESSLASLFTDQIPLVFVLKLSPHVLSIALKALVEGLAKRARIPSRVILTLVITISKLLCEHFLGHLNVLSGFYKPLRRWSKPCWMIGPRTSRTTVQ